MKVTPLSPIPEAPRRRKSNNNTNTIGDSSNSNGNRPRHAISTRGSSFGAEPNIQDRWSNKNMEHIRDLWQLDDEQFRQLSLFQDKLADVDHWKNNPYEAVRFVTGPQGYDKAEGLFREMIEWRLDNDIDTILDEYKSPKVLFDYLPSAILAGYDKEGDPIYLERGGAMDGHGLLTKYGQERMMKHICWSRELAFRGRWINDYEKDLGRPPTRLTIVYDLQGLSSRHMKAGVFPFLNECMMLTQRRYNGLAKRMIIIRAPSIFNIAWSLVKHVFPKNAVKKMVFSGPHNYLEVLDKYIDREVLPSCIVPGGQGRVAIDMPTRLDGGIIPDHLCLEEEVVPDAEEVSFGSGYESSASLESDNISESVRAGARSSSRSVRCKKITHGCWVAAPSTQTKFIQIFG